MQKEYKESFDSVIADIIVYGVILLIVLVVFGFNWFQTTEGTIDTSYYQCKKVVYLQRGFQTYWHNFTCQNIKTQSGKIMGGKCVATVNDKSLLSNTNNNICATAYVYEQDPSGGVCNDPQYPYLGYDDRCYTYPLLQSQ